MILIVILSLFLIRKIKLIEEHMLPMEALGLIIAGTCKMHHSCERMICQEPETSLSVHFTY